MELPPVLAEDEAALGSWLGRCRELADAGLDGIEDPAQQLAELASGDRRLMERARRAILAEIERRPDDLTLSQMLSFWRRAFEKGTWSWDDVETTGRPAAL